MEYSRNKTGDDTFVEAFNNLIKIKGCKIPRLTIALYWIDSDFYLSLDGNNCEHLKTIKMPYLNKDKDDGKYYLDYLKKFKQYLQDKG